MTDLAPHPDHHTGEAMTRLSEEELRELRTDHSEFVTPYGNRRCQCPQHRLLAHLDAIAESVEGLPSHEVQSYDGYLLTVDRAAVLAILRGTE